MKSMIQCLLSPLPWAGTNDFSASEISIKSLGRTYKPVKY